MLNALTIDVEDYFQVNAFEPYVERGRWDGFPLRVGDNVARLLDLVEPFGIRATFFILGWVAERLPALVREIHSRGHEIACHGHGHRRVTTQTRQEFREDIRRSKAVLEDLTGEAVHGYRAPSYSISRKTLWAFEELVEAGYLYDSSVFPVPHDFYGIPDWPRFPFTVSRGAAGEWGPHEAGADSVAAAMLEFPITTLLLCGKNFPIAGGGYFRLFPYRFTRWGLRRINRVEGRPFVFYLHPWELDPRQPRITGTGAKARLRHYLNLEKTEGRFVRLLRDFRFTTLRELVRAEAGRIPPCQPVLSPENDPAAAHGALSGRCA